MSIHVLCILLEIPYPSSTCNMKLALTYFQSSQGGLAACSFLVTTIPRRQLQRIHAIPRHGVGTGLRILELCSGLWRLAAIVNVRNEHQRTLIERNTTVALHQLLLHHRLSERPIFFTILSRRRRLQQRLLHTTRRRPRRPAGTILVGKVLLQWIDPERRVYANAAAEAVGDVVKAWRGADEIVDEVPRSPARRSLGRWRRRSQEGSGNGCQGLYGLERDPARLEL